MFLNKYNILSQNQYGFKSSISTTEIKTSLEINRYTVGVFIDLKNVFDTVDHDILCKNLHFYGVDRELFRK